MLESTVLQGAMFHFGKGSGRVFHNMYWVCLVEYCIATEQTLLFMVQS